MSSKYSPWNWLRNKFTRTIGIAVLIMWAIATVYPLIWAFFTSFKTNQELFANVWGPPTNLDWSNYEWALSSGNMAVCLRNSLIITAGSIIILFVISPMAAYALGRAEYRGKRTVFYFLLAGMYVAPQVIIVPLYVLLKNLGLIDSHLGLILVYVATALPYSIFIARLGFLSIPPSLEDAAKIDGLSTFQTYWRIALPLALPTVLIAMSLEAIFIWNDFLYPLVFLRSTDMMTLPLGLFIFRGQYLIQYGPLAAGIIISTIPPLILYMFFSEKIKKGIAAGIGAKT
ncbi:carbohydrate ABC transporter permease [Candidatus Bathyarchaeota archaeon]|nr:carbohydrate ABC transporter permease [Candidatus Bathyarchaeota archaeon]